MDEALFTKLQANTTYDNILNRNIVTSRFFRI